MRRVLLATHSLSFRFAPRVALTLLLVLAAAAAAARAEPAHRTLLREAAEAAKAGDTEQALAKLAAARDQRPDYPRVRLNLARTLAHAGRLAEAQAELDLLARMGLALDPARDPSLQRLVDQPGFGRTSEHFAANARPHGAGELAFRLDAMPGIVEGLACHPATGDWFFGDVHERCVWQRSADGTRLERFTPREDALLGVFDVAVDEARGALWLATALVPESGDYLEAGKGHAELVEYDLAARVIRRRLDLPVAPAGRALGSLTVAADGTVYATDSAANEIWSVRPAARRAELVLAHPDFVSLQGLALADGDRTLFVADYTNGLWRIDLASRRTDLLPAPADTTLFGLDGLAAAPGGLIAVQNGITPARVIRIDLDDQGRPRAVRPLEAAHPAMKDPTLGRIVGDHFVFIGDAGWSRDASAAVRSIPVFRTLLN